MPFPSPSKPIIRFLKDIIFHHRTWNLCRVLCLVAFFFLLYCSHWHCWNINSTWIICSSWNNNFSYLMLRYVLAVTSDHGSHLNCSTRTAMILNARTTHIPMTREAKLKYFHDHRLGRALWGGFTHSTKGQMLDQKMLHLKRSYPPGKKRFMLKHCWLSAQMWNQWSQLDTVWRKLNG